MNWTIFKINALILFLYFVASITLKAGIGLWFFGAGFQVIILTLVMLIAELSYQRFKNESPDSKKWRRASKACLASIALVLVIGFPACLGMADITHFRIAG